MIPTLVGILYNNAQHGTRSAHLRSPPTPFPATAAPCSAAAARAAGQRLRQQVLFRANYSADERRGLRRASDHLFSDNACCWTRARHRVRGKRPSFPAACCVRRHRWSSTFLSADAGFNLIALTQNRFSDLFAQRHAGGTIDVSTSSWRWLVWRKEKHRSRSWPGGAFLEERKK